MAAHLGAHETMEIHEILDATISMMNTMQLYRPHVRDPKLAQILDKQMQFTMNEYNHCVQSVQNVGGQPVQAAAYSAPRSFSPQYGLDHPAPASPSASANGIGDKEVACAMLGLHKSSASMKIIAALECANPQLRSMMQQSAVNCSEQAYEVWQYMNEAGYYQVPTMKEMTTNTVLNHYQPGMQSQGGAYQSMAQSNPNPYRQNMTYPTSLQ